MKELRVDGAHGERRASVGVHASYPGGRQEAIRRGGK